ncbi:hypothetical protein KAR52_02375 [Candidatus Pacearchaeota archaeon]|nr:hypothetical protein [Candidatus Pacearchaeota archaeon]
MKKEEIFSEEDISFLTQLINTLQEVELKLEEDYETKNYERLNNSKKFILRIQKKISEIIK